MERQLFDQDSNHESDSESNHSDLFDGDLDLSFMLENNQGEGEEAGAEERSLNDTIKENLIQWGLGVHRTKVTELLHIIHPIAPWLPLDSRTLLSSMRKVFTRDMPPGRYHHFGFGKGLKILLDSLRLSRPPEKIEIYWNNDGLPLTKSTTKKFIPILARLVNIIFIFIARNHEEKII